MKIASFLVFAVALSALAAEPPAVNLNAPIGELALKDGRTLTHVSLVSFATSAVMAKWDGGRGTISYEIFPDEYRAALARVRPAPTADVTPPAPKAKPIAEKKESDKAAAPQPLKPVEEIKFIVAGHAFATGMAQPYIFAGMKVRLLDSAQAVISETATDPQGHFSLTAPRKGEYKLIANGLRSYPNGTDAAYHWEIDLTKEENPGELTLSGKNAVITARVAGVIGVGL